MKPPPMDPWAPGVRAIDVPITAGGPPPLFGGDESKTGNGSDPNPFDNSFPGFEPASDNPRPTDADTPMIESALDYARRGWPVFPCKPTDKSPYVKGGLNAATTDEATIRNWWQRWPRAMIGVPTGSRSGMWAVDPDPPKKPEELDGRAIWAALVKEYGELLATHTESTPRGGQHILFKWDPAMPVTNSPGALAKTNIDVRGEGGYVIMAPSVSADGGRYSVVEPLDFFHFAMAPSWLYRLVLKKPEPKPAQTRGRREGSQSSSSGSGHSQQHESRADDDPAAPSDRRSNFFRNVNDAALANLSSWVPALLPNAKYQPGTGAWRISSHDLGRDLEEDLSISPKGTVDFGIHDMGDGRQGKRTAIDLVIDYGHAPDAKAAALWLCERMGIAPQSLGWNDGGSALFSAFFQNKDGGKGTGPDPEPTSGGDEQVEPAEPGPPPVGELPEALLSAPGLVGEIAGFITDTALYPQPALALGAALTIVGTAAGRRLAGPTRSGTHLYVVALAPSGAGKDHPRAMIGVILAAADMAACMGPSEFISMPAVYKFLAHAPLSVCAMDEFGAFLRRINNRKASGFEAQISATLRTAWGCSFKPMSTPEWANKTMATIYAPALSIFGVSTPAEFYASLDGADVTNGVLNRFVMIETRVRPSERIPTVDPTVVPPSILTGLKAIYGRGPANIFGIPRQETSVAEETRVPDHKKLDITPEAEAVRKGLVLEIQAMGDANKSLEPFLARTAENAIRIATILAIGQGSMTVDAAAMTWAKAFVTWSSHRMAEGAGLYIADSDTQAMANEIKRVLKEKGKRVPGWVLKKALAHKYKRRDLDEVLISLAETRTITVEQDTPTGAGRPAYRYTLVG